MKRYAIEDFYESGESRGRFEVSSFIPFARFPAQVSREEDERQCLAFIWNAHNLQGGAAEWHFTRRYCALELYLSRVGNPRGDLIKLTKERRWPMEFIPTFEFQIGREKTFERICSSCLSLDICFTCVDPIRPRIKKRFALSSR